MKAVIWSDVIQIMVLFGAILAVIVMAVHLTGGLTVIFDPPVRMRAVDFGNHGLAMAARLLSGPCPDPLKVGRPAGGRIMSPWHFMAREYWCCW